MQYIAVCYLFLVICKLRIVVIDILGPTCCLLVTAILGYS